MAATLDGKIGKTSDHLTNWTSQADKKNFVEETKKTGVIIIGNSTYQTIGKPLPDRLNIILSRNADESKNIPGSLEFTNKPPQEVLKNLEKRGFKNVILGGGATINGIFLKANLIDELWLTLEPKIFGAGLSIFQDVSVDLNLELIENRQLDKNILQVRYKIIK